MADERLPCRPATVVRWSLAGRTCEIRGGSSSLRARACVVLLGHVAAADAQPAADSLWLVEPEDHGPPWRLTHAASGVAHVCDSADYLVHLVEFQAIADLLARDTTTTTLHAALVDREDRGLLVVGPCESGKSTLGTALWRRGWTLLGDDVAVVPPPGGRARAVRRRVSLRFGSRPLVGEDCWSRIVASPSARETAEGYLFHPHEVDGSPPDGTTNLAAILFLARRGTATGSAELRPVEPATALLALAPYSNIIRQCGMGPALDRLQPLVDRVPAHDLGRGPLPDMLAAVEQLLDHV
jgi:hypothetical protein